MADFTPDTLQSLQNLRSRGFITEEEYGRRKKNLSGAQAHFLTSTTPIFKPTPTPTPTPTPSSVLFGGVSNEMEIQDPGWKMALSSEMSKPYFQTLKNFLSQERKKKKILPPPQEVFAALDLTPLDSVKVVILGQDPYHDIGQAHGLCFSVRPSCAVPPSLKNIYKELANDIPGFQIPKHGCLVKWATQGVLMLNATLTVEAHKANSHSKQGWQTFTDIIIKTINDKCSGVVFILWGNFAQKKGALVDEKKHKVIKAAHPSPLSQKAFFGCKVFSQTNRYLEGKFDTPIDWSLPNENPTLGLI